MIATLRLKPAPSPFSHTTDGPPALLVFGLPAALLAFGGLALMRGGRSRRRASDAD
jgi:hypothetical protein